MTDYTKELAEIRRREQKRVEWELYEGAAITAVDDRTTLIVDEQAAEIELLRALVLPACQTHGSMKSPHCADCFENPASHPD